jgi:hypothetical protein
MESDSDLDHETPVAGQKDLNYDSLHPDILYSSNIQEAKRIGASYQIGMNFNKNIKISEDNKPNPFKMTGNSGPSSSLMTPQNTLNQGVVNLLSASIEENKQSLPKYSVPPQLIKTDYPPPPLLNKQGKLPGQPFSPRSNLPDAIQSKVSPAGLPSVVNISPNLKKPFNPPTNFTGISGKGNQQASENFLKVAENSKFESFSFDTYKTPPARQDEFLPTEQAIKKQNFVVISAQKSATNFLPLNIPKNELPKNIQKQKSLTQRKKQFVSILVDFIDVEKVLGNQTLFNKISRNLIEKYSEIKEKVEEIQRVNCSCCKKNSDLHVLRCKCILCKSCIREVILMLSNVRLSRNYSTKSKCCPNCRSAFSRQEEEELKSLCSLDETQIERFSKINSIENKLKVKCGICKKNKLRYQENSCFHACLECQISLFRSNEANCPICRSEWFFQDISSETFDCQGCLRQSNPYTKLFYSNFGISLHSETCFLCLGCAYNSTLTSKCEGCDKYLKQSEKIELNFLIFTVCTKCKHETFRGHASFSSDEKNSIYCKSCS